MKFSSNLLDTPVITVFDPLAQILGAVEDGVLEISFLDCVKLAGHSCPTVASSFLMAQKGISALYGSDMPVRGDIRVSLRESKEQGVVGVIGAVIGYILGASDEGGFKGLGGKYARNKRLVYGQVKQEAFLELERLDNGKKVAINFDLTTLPADEKLQNLMTRVVSGGEVSQQELQEFGNLWQERVIYLLKNANQFIHVV